METRRQDVEPQETKGTVGRRDMSSRRIVGFAGHLWARTRVVVNGQQLRVSAGHTKLQFPTTCPPG